MTDSAPFAHPVDKLTKKAEALRASVRAPEILILPEMWDVATGQILLEAGFKMIGTSAAAIAWSNGYRPHERVKLQDLLMAAARIVRRHDVPVNADLEGGIGRSIDQVKHAVKAAIQVGCAGITLSDGSRGGAHGIMPVEEMTNRLKAARMAAIETGVPLHITARSEEFNLGALGQSPYDETLIRAEQYFEAGADCILVSGIQNVLVVERLAKNINGPTAIAIDLASAPNINEYSSIGIASVSLGSVSCDQC